MLMEQKQFEQKLQFQLQQQQKHWHEEKQARLIAQIPQYIDPALVCTPTSMSATVFNQEQQLQQSIANYKTMHTDVKLSIEYGSN